jgi:hypothetical protein
MNEYDHMANTIGVSPGGDRTDDGGYTIQLISDTIDLEAYVGMRMVYLSGTYFPPQDPSHRRDIVLNVESIYEVW